MLLCLVTLIPVDDIHSAREISHLSGNMSETSQENAALQFYYFGLYRALKRYRVSIILGWTIVCVGCASIPLGWRFFGFQGIVDISLSCCTVLAGIALVQLGVSSLDVYIRIPFPREDHAGTLPRTAMDEITRVMEDIERGGWHEAHSAMNKLKGMEATHGLPALH